MKKRLSRKECLNYAFIAAGVMVYSLSHNVCVADINVTENSTLGFHGYMRASGGVTDEGEGQVAFQAPGAVTKYRLGNEADTNIELAGDYRYFLNSTKGKNDPSVQALFMVDGYTTRDDGNDISLDHLAQGYFSFDNILGDGIKVWGGRRYIMIVKIPI